MTALLALCLALTGPIDTAVETEGMGIYDARHLLSRTGFGVSPAKLREFAELERASAVSRLLDGLRVEPRTPLPDWFSKPAADLYRGRRDMTPEERRQRQRTINQMGLRAKGWWIQEMIETESPLTERLTLMWHNHFTTGFRKVRFPHLILGQNLTLRKLAAGNFREFLHAISRDPAMVLYLDNQSNNKRRPNENYAREVMELFTLGEGHYTEADIKAAARAFTGWKVRRDDGSFIFLRRQHDGGEKTFFGKTGRFDGDDVLDIILEKPRVATYITERLWREFISPTPDAAEVERLADRFREDYELRPLLERLFTSEHFWSDGNRGTLVKSPVELVVGTIRTFSIPTPTEQTFQTVWASCRQLGQDVMDPPNVKGWPGGEHWISANTILNREMLLSRMSAGESDAAARERRRRMDGNMMRGSAARLEDWMGSLGKTVQDQHALAARVLLPGDALTAVPPGNDHRTFVRHLLLDPMYNLK